MDTVQPTPHSRPGDAAETVEVSLDDNVVSTPQFASERHDTEFSTLDEPVLQTVMRDAKAVGRKFFHVICPAKSQSLLKDWDLWGPLILCTFLSLMLHTPETKTEAGAIKSSGIAFATVFVIYWVGAAVVTLNSKLLGGSLYVFFRVRSDRSFFQSVCVLGYCVFPLCVALLICRSIEIVEQNTILFVIRSVVVLLAFGWSTFASTAFLASVHEPRRKALAVYPVFLFYFVLAWMVVSN